jgi:hypothetical protein
MHVGADELLDHRLTMTHTFVAVVLLLTNVIAPLSHISQGRLVGAERWSEKSVVGVPLVLMLTSAEAMRELPTLLYNADTEVTVKLAPLLPSPPTVTMTLPVVAPLGTGATMLVAPQLVGIAAVPLNVTVLVPCVEPKFVPVMVTEVPTGPELGERPLMLGATVTVKLAPLLASPFTVTTTLPLVAPVGTATVMLLLQFDAGVTVPTDVPLKVTVLDPCVAPKFVPVMVTRVPAGPEVGDKLVMLGFGEDPPPPLMAGPTL